MGNCQSQEKGTYEAKAFLEELKEMVRQIVLNVKSDNRRSFSSSATNKPDNIIGNICPVCAKGTIIKGNTAYGCSNWKNGCTYRQPFT